MDRTRWQRIGEVFAAVSEMSGEALKTALDEHCGDDDALRREVESLLAADRDAGDWLAGLTARAGVPDPDAEAALNEPGRVIGSWRLKRQIGRGGMGVVYLAERADEQFRMDAALKVLPVGLSTRESVRRFQREREILAQLEHPHIARLVDGGVTPEGTPYYVMEYVEGLPLNRYCDKNWLALAERIGLFERIAGAVAYAHQHLVIHRDIKPANILVTDSGEPKLLDFGVAKLVDADAEHTRTATQLAQRRVTPAYTAPELLQGEPVTTACDVYSLGVVLYELLSGTPPFEPGFFDRPGWTDKLAEYRPVPPSRAADAAVGHKLKGDLDTIVAMAMHPDPARRYATVNALLADLERHRKRLPVVARADTLAYRSGRFIRRHAVGSVLSALAAVSLLAGLGATSYYAVEAARQAVEARQERDRAESLREFLLELFHAAEPSRPQDELPSTEEILALGAERAMRQDIASDAERLGMLLTVGDVYVAQNRLEHARPLIEEAVSLGRKHSEERPADLAQALRAQANLAMNERQFDDAKELFLEAESIQGLKDSQWGTYALIRARHAYLEILRSNPEQAMTILEPLYEALPNHSNVTERLRFNIVNSLSIAYQHVGKLQAGSSLSSEVIEIVRNLYGPTSSQYAIVLANSANLARRLAQYDIAEARVREALDLYDRIFSEPSSYRAASHLILARTLFYKGQYDKALERMAESSREWARSFNIEVESYPFYYLNRGMLFTRMRRWEDAMEMVGKARALVDRDDRYGSDVAVRADALMALVLCHAGRVEHGSAVLAELDERLDGGLPTLDEYRARIHEARAVCAFQSGNPEAALEEIDMALTALSLPGLVVEISDCKVLRARALAALGQHDAARAELGDARKLFLDLELSDHPALMHIENAGTEISYIQGNLES